MYPLNVALQSIIINILINVSPLLHSMSMRNYIVHLLIIVLTIRKVITDLTMHTYYPFFEFNINKKLHY